MSIKSTDFEITSSSGETVTPLKRIRRSVSIKVNQDMTPAQLETFGRDILGRQVKMFNQQYTVESFRVEHDNIMLFTFDRESDIEQMRRVRAEEKSMFAAIEKLFQTK